MWRKYALFPLLLMFVKLVFLKPFLFCTHQRFCVLNFLKKVKFVVPLYKPLGRCHLSSVHMTNIASDHPTQKTICINHSAIMLEPHKANVGPSTFGCYFYTVLRNGIFWRFFKTRRFILCIKKNNSFFLTFISPKGEPTFINFFTGTHLNYIQIRTKNIEGND
jgi:hypothetical protein